MSEVDSCGEECLRLCNDNLGNVCSEGCKREWNGCKGIPQDPVWLDPQTECLDGVNREPSHPGDTLNEFSELNVTLAISIFVKDA